MPETQTITSDEELARQAQAGSLFSFEELVTRHEAGVFRFLARCCRNEADAQDLTQTTFVTAYRSLSQYRSENRFAPWLFTIARRKFIDHFRANRPPTQPVLDEEACDHNHPAAILENRERQSGIWATVRRSLSQDQFSALWLKYQEDMSVVEIARVLGRTQTSVKVLLFRGRQALLGVFGGNRPPKTAGNHLAPTNAGHNPNSSSRGWKGTQSATSFSAEGK